MAEVTVSPDGRSSTHTYGSFSTPRLEELLDRALDRMNGDALAAGRLFMAWSEQDSEVHALIPPLVAEYVMRRMEERANQTDVTTRPDFSNEPAAIESNPPQE
jgi:hypothetical protein